MSIKKQKQGDKITIFIEDKFDYALQKEFRACYDSIDPSVKLYEIDLSKATYMDSAAIGMLLVMNDRLEEANAKIQIINVSEEVKDLLEIANIDRLIPIK